MTDKKTLLNQPPDALRLVKRSLQRYFYAAGINIFLHQALKKKEAEEFKNKIEKALKRQISHVATVDKIQGLIGERQKIENPNLLVGLGLIWLALSEQLDGEKATILTFLLWAGSQGGKSALEKMIPDHNFELNNLEIQNKLSQRADFLTGVVDKTTQRWVVNVLEEGLALGLTTEEITKYLKKESEKMIRERSQLITETELGNAMGMVELETYKRNKIEKHKWVTSEDERTCILGGNAKVSTLNGFKNIKDIEIGDFVLTHKDRYKKVIKKFKRSYTGKVVRIFLKTRGICRSGAKMTVTDEHPILIKREGKDIWCEAKSLLSSDMVYFIGKKCICGKIIPFTSSICNSCSTKKFNKKKWKREGEKERLIMFNKKYKKVKLMKKAQMIDLIKNPYKYVLARKKASETIKKRWNSEEKFREIYIRNNCRTAKYPNHPFKIINGDKKRKEEVLKLAHKSLGKNHLGYTFIEKKMRWFLIKENINFIPQWFYKYNGKWGWADFYLPSIKTVIECDGFFHNLKDIQKKDEEKDQWFKENGINILRFSSQQIRNNFFEVASKIKQLNCILPIAIRKLDKWQLKPRTKNFPGQIVYNLTVEEDQSYTVNGMVVHNCEICLVNEAVGSIKVGDEFPGGVTAPIQHLNCRCFLLPVLPTTIEGAIWTGE